MGRGFLRGLIWGVLFAIGTLVVLSVIGPVPQGPLVPQDAPGPVALTATAPEADVAASDVAPAGPISTPPAAEALAEPTPAEDIKAPEAAEVAAAMPATPEGAITAPQASAAVEPETMPPVAEAVAPEAVTPEVAIPDAIAPEPVTPDAVPPVADPLPSGEGVVERLAATDPAPAVPAAVPEAVAPAKAASVAPSPTAPSADVPPVEAKAPGVPTVASAPDAAPSVAPLVQADAPVAAPQPSPEQAQAARPLAEDVRVAGGEAPATPSVSPADDTLQVAENTAPPAPVVDRPAEAASPGLADAPAAALPDVQDPAARVDEPATPIVTAEPGSAPPVAEPPPEAPAPEKVIVADASPPEGSGADPATPTILVEGGKTVLPEAPPLSEPPLLTPLAPLPPAKGFAPEVPGVTTGRLPRIGDVADETAATVPAADASVAADGPPLRRYAQAFENPAAKPLFSIVLIDTGGIDLDRAALAALPFPVSFALDPNAPETPLAATIYRAAGQEVLMLATGIPEGATASDLEQTFAANATALPEAVAVLDVEANGFQGNRALASLVVPIVKGQGRGVLSWDRGLNAASQVARREGVAEGVIFRRLDGQDENEATIRRYLDRAAFKAAQDGRVIVAGETRPETVAALLAWTVEGRATTVALAPLSATLSAQ